MNNIDIHSNLNDCKCECEYSQDNKTLISRNYVNKDNVYVRKELYEDNNLVYLMILHNDNIYEIIDHDLIKFKRSNRKLIGNINNSIIRINNEQIKFISIISLFYNNTNKYVYDELYDLINSTLKLPYGIVTEYEQNLENLYLDGIYKDYNDNGILIEHSHYTKGKLNGEYIENDNNGKLKLHCFYKNGKLDGEYSEYDEYGNIVKKIFYKDGILTEKYEEWCEDG